jgi:hypothetical protein
MPGLKVANMAAAVWPHLAKQPEPDRRQTSGEARPEWGKSNDALWSEPRPVPNKYDRVPGLVRVRKWERCHGENN